jgi:diacylglycerol kinase family enzyme
MNNKKVTIPPSIPDKHLLLVGNPTSNSGKALRRIELAQHFLTEKKVPFEFRATLPDGKTVDMVRDAVDNDDFDTVVYMGGDGTFYEVATGIVTSSRSGSVKMGMLPSGTANDQGKSFGISSAESALDENINIVLRAHTEVIDVGKVTAYDINDKIISTDYFFDSVGWGLSAAILAFRNKELELVKKMPVVRDMYRDQAVYIRAGIHVFGLNWLTRDRFSVEIEVDGKVHMLNGLSDLVISNTAVYAGEWLLDANSSPSDGMVEIAPFASLADWTRKLIVKHKKNPFPYDFVEKIGLSSAVNLQGRLIKIRFFRPAVDKHLPAQRDGEEFVTAEDYQIEVLPRVLSVIVPKNFHWI